MSNRVLQCSQLVRVCVMSLIAMHTITGFCTEPEPQGSRKCGRDAAAHDGPEDQYMGSHVWVTWEN